MLLKFPDLEYFLGLKTVADLILSSLFDKFDIDSAFGLKTKFVAHKINYNFHLWSNFISGLKIIVSSWSKQHHDKP